jgi:hypothetical protein
MGKTDEVAKGQSKPRNATELKIRRNSSGSAAQQPSPSRIAERSNSNAKDQQSAKAEQKHSSFEALKGSLESSVSKDKE